MEFQCLKIKRLVRGLTLKTCMVLFGRFYGGEVYLNEGKSCKISLSNLLTLMSGMGIDLTSGAVKLVKANF